MRRENNNIEEEGIQEWEGGGERLKLWRRREINKIVEEGIKTLRRET